MRLRQLLAAALTALVLPAADTAVALAVRAPAVPHEALPAPPSTPAALDARYDATREAVEVALAAAGHAGDDDRIAALTALARPDRRLLHFDPAGDGRAVEVLGDLTRARRIAIIVPGAATRLETFDGHGGTPWAAPGGAARAVYAEAARQDPDARFAVIAWLGYQTPRTASVDVLTDHRARDGAAQLRALVTALRQVNGAEIGLLCHSYGSVVCGRAADGLPVTDLAVYGSPGMGVATAADLGTGARVWAARGSGDWTRHMPHVRVALRETGLGFGADPADPAFGARGFRAGSAGHSDYLAPASASLHDLTAIALGRADEVDRG